MTVDLNFYPGFKRKAISFTIDDGNLVLDKKFIDYVKPAGIKGSFNLVSSFIAPSKRAAYKEQYSEYEIVNHQKYHPMAIPDGDYEISDDEFNAETADTDKLYKTGIDGLYYYYLKNNKRWFKGAFTEDYLRFMREGREELEELFERRVRDFVWPYGKQRGEALFEAVKKEGYRSVRGAVYDGFDLPKDRMHWGFYATYQNMLERAERVDALPDDGSLKAFIFGVHAHDFENAGRWDVLQDFCKLYGNRDDDFFYATVGEIFDCEDAIKAAVVSENSVENVSDLPLFALIDGEKVVIPPKSIHYFKG